ncbi:hypothetical protein JCM8097_001059 [Rhodosporidiobolus ruineniae]
MPLARDDYPRPSTTDKPVDSLDIDQLSLGPSKPDYLSSLPPELLRRIFELTYEGGSYIRAPLSRYLAPFHHEMIYQFVALDCHGCLERFANHILAARDLGKLVKAFRLWINENKARQAPSGSLIGKLFAALPNLNILDLAGNTPVVSLILKPAFAKKHLPKLFSLTIDSPFSSTRSPFHPSHFSGLAKYPALKAFDLQIDRKDDEPFHHVLQSPPPALIQHFSRLTALRLSSTYLDGLSAEAMLRSCGGLVHLELSDEGGTVDLAKLVECLSDSSQLQSLVLWCCPPGDNLPIVDIVPFLRRALHLEHLELAGPFNLSPAFFTALAPLASLRTFDIGPYTTLLPSTLLTFFATSFVRPTSLRTLTLDNILAIRGASTDADDPHNIYRDVETDEPIPPPGWHLPRWTEVWTEAAVEEVREAAEKAGIEVGGMTLEAAQVERDFEAEVDKVEMVAEGEALAWEEKMMEEDEWETDEEDGEEDEEEEHEEEEEEEEEDEEEPAARRTLNNLD